MLGACLLSMATGCQLYTCTTPLAKAPASLGPEPVRELLGTNRSKDMYEPSLPPPVQTEAEAELVDSNPSVYAVDPQAGSLLYNTDAVASEDRKGAEQEWEASEPPRELSMVMLPTYRIEPPDIIRLQVIKLVPRSPRHIEAYDRLFVNVRGTQKDLPIKNTITVESGGEVTLGPTYGTVLVEGLTIEEAREKIEQHLKKVLENPEVAVQIVRSDNDEPNLSDVYKVEPDGTVTLNRYGRFTWRAKPWRSAPGNRRPSLLVF